MVVAVEFESEDENIQTNLGALPNSEKVSSAMSETLGVLMNSRSSIKLTQNDL